jgi:Dolichyl-phosphate-mannose-protein mannosyltransferase
LTTTSRTAGTTLFVAALALGIAVRAVDFLNCRSLGLDEARLAVNVASRSFLGLLRPLDLDQSAPPLFLWGERLVFLLLGQSDCGLRLIPVVAGTAAGMLMYPLAARFLEETGARLAAVLAMVSPLLITYSNAVKQYSVELLVAVVLLLFFERELRRDRRPRTGHMLAAGAVAPWISLFSVFVLSAAWLVTAARGLRREAGAVRLSLVSALVWGISGAFAYATVYRAAGRSPYLQRFWELAFVRPTRRGFAGQAWKTLEDQVWGFVAGDPLIDRRPFLVLLHVATVLVVALCALGCRRVLRTRGSVAWWWLIGPALLTLAASLLGLFPISPRLSLYLLPGFIVLFIAGMSDLLASGDQPVPPRRLAIAGAVLLLPLAGMAIVRTFSLEPRGHFQRLVRELRQHRRPGEPVYIFARTLPPWIYYTTDWWNPDTARLRFLMAAAHSTGAAFENAPSRGRVGQEEVRAVTSPLAAPGELLGLPSGMEWREVQEHIKVEPDSGWVEVERRRIEGAANPGVWVIATAFYAAESELFRTLERDASRRTFAHLRGGSALVRYEFEPAPSSPDSMVPARRQSGSPTSFGRLRTTTSAHQDQQFPVQAFDLLDVCSLKGDRVGRVIKGPVRLPVRTCPVIHVRFVRQRKVGKDENWLLLAGQLGQSSTLPVEELGRFRRVGKAVDSAPDD